MISLPNELDGRIVVLRKSDQKNHIVQYHSDIRSDKIEKLTTGSSGFCLTDYKDGLKKERKNKTKTKDKE